MSQISPDEFFRERPAQVKDLLHGGLVLIGLSAFFWLVNPGHRSSFPPLLWWGAFGIAFLVGAGVKWLRRRRGLRATNVGLSEVFSQGQERLHEWREIKGIEETANEAGRAFTVKTAHGEVKFDTHVEGWERLVARIRAELAERKPAAVGVATAPEKAEAETEPEQPALARLAPWLGNLPRILRYPWSSYHKIVGAWVGTLLGLLLIGLMARGGYLHPSLFPWVMVVFALFLGISYGLRHAQRRVENASVILSEDGLAVIGAEGIERRFAWEEVLHAQEVQRSFNPYHTPSVQARWVLARRAIQVRTPWGYFEIDRGLEEYDRLLELLQLIVAVRDRPPDYPAARLVASDAALSRATAPAEPTPTAASLSRAEEPEEEPPRLAAAVTETEAEPAGVEVRVER